MADENKQNTDNAAPAENSDPFAGFQSEAFQDGKPIEPKGGEKPAPKGEEKTTQSVPHIPDEDDPLAAFSDQEDDDADLQSDDQGSGDEFDGAGHDDERARADADGDSGEDEDEDAEAEADQEGEETSRNKVPLKKRLSQLTAARRRAERENAELKARLREIEQGKQGDGDGQRDQQQADDDKGEKREQKADTQVLDADGNVVEKPDPQKYTYGEVDPDYINDVVNYNVEARMSKQRAAEAERQAKAAEQSQAQELRQRWNDISEQGAEKYEDFEAVVLEPAMRGAFPLTKEMAVEIGDSEVATDIVYHLARNPKEAKKVAGMEPRKLARYIGRLEAAIQTRDKQRDKGERRMTNASPPPRRQPRGAGGQFVSKAASSDFSAFEKQAMAAEDRKR